MQGSRLLKWSGSVLSPRTRPDQLQSSFHNLRRFQTTAAALSDAHNGPSFVLPPSTYLSEDELLKLPSPPVAAAVTSAKLAALHARLSLPARFPLETLARTLVDPSADTSPKFNNKAFALLGNDLLGYYTSEYIVSQYPRLPLPVVFAAMYAYHGPATLMQMAREWGVEPVAEPGGEVDPGYLQFKRIPPGQEDPDVKHGSNDPRADRRRPEDLTTNGVSLQRASTNFVRALVGAVHLHTGRASAKQFYKDHFMSRKLDVATLFQFRNPTRDLSRLCAREGFRAPVAKILSETGRKTRTPVFVVGIFSGSDLLGEGAGASLEEARVRAAVAALKGWYLYSPTHFRLPSDMEEPGAKAWTPVLVDAGEILDS